MKKKTTSAPNKPRRSRPVADHYLYTVGWSEDDEAYVALVAEFPSLAAHGNTQEAALRSLQQLLRVVLRDLAASKKPIAQPIASVHFSADSRRPQLRGLTRSELTSTFRET